MIRAAARVSSGDTLGSTSSATMRRFAVREHMQRALPQCLCQRRVGDDEDAVHGGWWDGPADYARPPTRYVKEGLHGTRRIGSRLLKASGAPSKKVVERLGRRRLAQHRGLVERHAAVGAAGGRTTARAGRRPAGGRRLAWPLRRRPPAAGAGRCRGAPAPAQRPRQRRALDRPCAGQLRPGGGTPGLHPAVGLGRDRRPGRGQRRRWRRRPRSRPCRPAPLRSPSGSWRLARSGLQGSSTTRPSSPDRHLAPVEGRAAAGQPARRPARARRGEAERGARGHRAAIIGRAPPSIAAGRKLPMRP